jgi:hypothetical protein
MKNKILLSFFFFLLISLTACSQNMEYSKIIKFPYSSEKEAKEIIFGYNKEGNFFPNEIDFDISKFDNNYKYNISKKWDYYNKIYYLSRNIGHFKDSKYVFSISSVLKNDDYGQYVYEQWIKSFNEKNEVIDSLQIVYYTAYTGIHQRMNSVIVSPEKIEIEHFRLEWEPEKDDPNDLSKIKTIKGEFLIKDGRFIFQNSSKLGVFFNDFNYGDIYSNISKECEFVSKSKFVDINGDGVLDAIYFLKRKKNGECTDFLKSNLALCLGERHGLLKWTGTEHFEWDNPIFQMEDIKVINSDIVLTLKSKKSSKSYSAVSKYGKKRMEVYQIIEAKSEKVLWNFEENGGIKIQEIQGKIKEIENIR